LTVMRWLSLLSQRDLLRFLTFREPNTWHHAGSAQPEPTPSCLRRGTAERGGETTAAESPDFRSVSFHSYRVRTASQNSPKWRSLLRAFLSPSQ